MDKEGKALSWTRLSCTRFASNQVRLALFVLAYNMGNFLRRFALPSEVSHWSLSSIQLKLIKIGAKVVSHSRRTLFQMAEVAVPEALFAALLERVRCLAGADLIDTEVVHMKAETTVNGPQTSPKTASTGTCLLYTSPSPRD